MNVATDFWNAPVLAQAHRRDLPEYRSQAPRPSATAADAPHRHGPDREPTQSLGSLAAVIGRRWRLVALVTLGCLVAASLVGAMVPPKYEASTSLVVSPSTADPLGAAVGDVNIRTEREVLGSREVARRAAERLGVELGPESYLLTAEVAAPSGSQVLVVSVSAPTPQEAADAANALATAYLEFRSEGAVEVAERYIASIDERLAGLSEQDGPLAVSLIEQRSRLSLIGSDPGRIIGPAAVPESPASPGEAMFLATGLVGGLLLGGFLALVRDRLDGRVRTAGRLAEATGGIVVSSLGSTVDEAWRQAAFTLRRHARRDALVCLIGPQDDGAALSRLEHELRRAGLVATVAARPERLGQAIDDGWPVTPGETPSDVVLADLSGLRSAARLATVLERAHAVVLVTTPRTRLRDARAVAAARALGRTELLVGVLLKHKRRRTERKERRHR